MKSRDLRISLLLVNFYLRNLLIFCSGSGGEGKRDSMEG